jgi:hypothetical protein
MDRNGASKGSLSRRRRLDQDLRRSPARNGAADSRGSGVRPGWPVTASDVQAAGLSTERYTWNPAEQGNRCALYNAMPPGGLEPPTHGFRKLGRSESGRGVVVRRGSRRGSRNRRLPVQLPGERPCLPRAGGAHERSSRSAAAVDQPRAHRLGDTASTRLGEGETSIA